MHDESPQVAADAGLVGLGLLGPVALSLGRVVGRTGLLSSCAAAVVVCWTVAGLSDISWRVPVLGLLGGWSTGLVAVQDDSP